MSTPASLYERGVGWLEVMSGGRGAGPDAGLRLLGTDGGAPGKARNRICQRF
jgi:hypothetical protein